MSQGPHQSKASTSRNASSMNTTGSSRLLQNYPLEPIGTRPSYVGELVAILRDGTPEMRGILESECDLRFNCKVCGSILPSTRSFVIHKRQFCTTKYIEYQRRNVAIMERISNVVAFETIGLQTGDDMLELDNPINASLLIPLTVPPPLSMHSTQNGSSFRPLENGTADAMDLEDQGRDSQDVETDIPAGVEIIQPARPPADGVYRFGMGGMNLMANRKKKTRVHASGNVKKKRKQVHVIRDSFSAPKKILPESLTPKKLPADAITRSQKAPPIMTVTKPAPVKLPPLLSPMECRDLLSGETSDETSSTPFTAVTQSQRKVVEPFKRSRRLGPPINGFDMSTPPAAAVSVVELDANKISVVDPEDSNGNAADRTRDVKDPVFVRRLLDQLAEVADYQKKMCKECNRMVVSIYNLDRHVATQHLGLRETEYSLISKELRRLRTEVFGPLKAETEEENADGLATRQSRESSQVDNSEEELEEEDGQLHSGLNGVSFEEDLLVKNEPPPLAPPTTSRPSPSDSETITERLTAMMRNPETLKEILTTKEKEQPLIDYELHQLVEIQRQILDAADPFLQCCRICNKQYFDVYVLNRHVMTVHLRLPERSCGPINKMIKDSMKRFPHAFGNAIPLDNRLE